MVPEIFQIIHNTQQVCQGLVLVLSTSLYILTEFTWWRHQIETFSSSLAICARNSTVPGEFPTQRPVTRSYGVFFDLRLNKRLSRQSWCWGFETLSRPLWRHCNESTIQYWRIIMVIKKHWATEAEYSGSITWLMTTWIVASPGFQQPLCWLCRMSRPLSSCGIHFNQLRNLNLEKWSYVETYLYFSLNKFSTLRVTSIWGPFLLLWFNFNAGMDK